MKKIILLLLCFLSTEFRVLGMEQMPTQMPEASDILGNSPLYYAALDDNESAARVLLSSISDESKKQKLINAKNSEGDTALHGAARRGNRAIIGLLLDAGADINTVNNYNETPLHQAAWELKPDAVELLLERGANPLICCNYPQDGFIQSVPPLLMASKRIIDFTPYWPEKTRCLMEAKRKIIALLFPRSNVRVYEQRSCPLCLENYQVNQQVLLLPCGHLLGHIECTNESRWNQCIICRGEINHCQVELTITEDLLKILNG